MSTGDEVSEPDVALAEVNVVDFEEMVESFGEADIERFEKEVEAFRDEVARAGKSAPVLYVDDHLYEAGSDDRGVLDGSIPVRVLPKDADLFAQSSRFSFGEGMEDVLEEGAALIVNPAGEETVSGQTHLEIDEDLAREAYEQAVDHQGGLEYLDGFKGVQVREFRDVVELQIDEESLGTRVEYLMTDDALYVGIGDERIEVSYDNDVKAGSVDKHEDQIVQAGVDGDAQIYKFVLD